MVRKGGRLDDENEPLDTGGGAEVGLTMGAISHARIGSYLMLQVD